MGGWRDSEGRTAQQRRTDSGAAARAKLADTVRRRPLSLVKPALAAIFVAILIAALLLRW
jgi:hypothetical protein